jgi:hypothetical protein
MYIWQGTYIIISLIHIFLAYKYLRFIPKIPKIVFLVILGLLYLCFAYSYMII